MHIVTAFSFKLDYLHMNDPYGRKLKGSTLYGKTVNQFGRIG